MMLRQIFAVIAILCLSNSIKFAQSKGIWWDRDSPSTEVEETEETARFNPFLYTLPNQLAEYLRIPQPETQETEFALQGAVPQEDEIEYETKARQTLEARRRRPERTTKKPKRKRPQKKQKPPRVPVIPVQQHQIPKDPSSIFGHAPDMKQPETGDFGYPYFDAENYYPPPPLPFWPPPYPPPYYGYPPPPEQQYGQQPSTTQSRPAPQPTAQPQLQLQIPTDENTLHLLQLALLLQQTLATAAAVTAASPNISATAAIIGSTAVPINGASAVRPSAGAISSLLSVSSPAAGSSQPTVVTSPKIQQTFAVATTVRPAVETAVQATAAAAAAAANTDDIVIGDNKQASSFLNALKSFVKPDALESTEPEKTTAVPSVESEVIVEPAKVTVNPMQLIDSPVLYVRQPLPATKSPEKPVQDLKAEIESPSDTLTTEKEIVASVPYYPRADDATMAEDYQMTGQRYIKPIGYRPDSPDSFQGRRRGKSRVLRR